MTRKFPSPWPVEETTGGAYVVLDAKGFRLAYVYGRDEEAMRLHHLTSREATKIAQAIAPLPELWHK